MFVARSSFSRDTCVMNGEDGPKFPKKGTPSRQESATRARWMRIDVTSPRSRESVQNEKRRARVREFGKLNPKTVFRYRGTVYLVGKIDWQTGYVKCKKAGEKSKTFKDFNVLRENLDEIQILKQADDETENF